MRYWKLATPVALALALAAATASPAAAQRNRNNNQAAPATGVVVLNFQRVLAESTAGRGINAGLQQIGAQINAELQALAPEGQAISAEQERLTTATRNQTAEQRRANPQIAALATRVEAFQTRQRQLQADMRCTEALVMRDFERQVTPAVQTVMRTRNAGIVLDSASVQLNAPELDITNDVLQAVNTSTPSIAVARHGYAECTGQTAAPAPAAPAPTP